MKRTEKIGFSRGWFAALTVAAAMLCAPAHAAEKVTIGQSSRNFNPGLSNMWIGTQIGLYGPDLEAETVGTPGATENLQLMLSGRLQLTTGTQDVALNAMAEGRSLPAVSPCIYLRGMIQRVAVLEDSPIRSFADLKGKKVGSQSLSSTQVPYLRFAVKAAGVDPSEVQIVAVGSGQQAATAVTSRQVDALVAADVEVAAQLAARVPLRVLDQPESIKDAAVAYAFVFQRPWYEANKDKAVQMLQGMIKAIIVMLENPEAAVRISYHMHPQAIPSGVSFETAVQQGIAATKVRATAVSKTAMGYKRWCEFSQDAWANYMSMLGIEGKVDPAKFYTDEIVDRVNDFDEPKFREWARSLKVPEKLEDYRTWAAALTPP